MMANPLRKLVGVLLFAVLCTVVLAQQSPPPRKVVKMGQGCQAYQKSQQPPQPGGSAPPIQKTIQLWQGIVLLLCFGAFALFVSLVHRIIRTYIYYDAYLLDTFFDAGGDVNFALIACAVVSRWLFTSSFTTSTLDTFRHGIVGHFWFSAGCVVAILLFSIVAAEIRIKAPGAKTFLQVIYSRYGALPHIIVMIFTFVVNILICAMVMRESTEVLTAVTQGFSKEVCAIIIAIVVAIYSVVGGVGGSIYVAYFSCALILSIVMVFVTDIFHNPLAREGNVFGNVSSVFDAFQCAYIDGENEGNSPLTFLSRDGMIEGILLLLSSFTCVFVNQSFWQVSVASKPHHTVAGFIIGGICWFIIPFAVSFSLGVVYWVYSVKLGAPLLSKEQEAAGLIPVMVAQKLMGNTGDFLMYVMMMVAAVTTLAGEVLATSSIVIYDIYQTYITPFRVTGTMEGQTSIRMQRLEQSEKYREYDGRSVVMKHVVVVCAAVLLIPISLVVNVVPDVDLRYLFFFTTILAGSCVIPIALAITWHRITTAGVATGALGGFAAAFIAWLVLSSTLSSAGLTAFYESTSDWRALMVGTCVAIGVGGLLCIIVSLSCGGCDNDLREEEEWEKTRIIDSPILPWSVKYAPNIGATHLTKGKPHFYTVRKVFKCPEICAYIFGVLLSVLAVLVWPACMLTTNIWGIEIFSNWSWVVLIWLIVVLIFMVVFPLVWEIVQTCQQAYYNRAWSRRQRLQEEHSEVSEPSQPPPHLQPKLPSPPPSTLSRGGSDFQSTLGRDSGLGGERWKTFIRLDG